MACIPHASNFNLDVHFHTHLLSVVLLVYLWLQIQEVVSVVIPQAPPPLLLR